MGNLQPPVTRTLLPGTKEVYGQLLLLDFNQPELQPFTAYGQVLKEIGGQVLKYYEILKRIGGGQVLTTTNHCLPVVWQAI